MKKICAIILLAIVISSCNNKFNEVKIGDQVWMAENLNVDKFRNGDPILMAQTREEWLEASINGVPAWCYYNNDSLNQKKYGKLYNWHAVADPRGLAPSGWRIPNEEDWEILIESAGGELDANDKLRNSFGWDNHNGINEIGFAANAGGERTFNTAEFYGLRHKGEWWTSTMKTEKKRGGKYSEIYDTPFWRENAVYYVIGVKKDGVRKIYSDVDNKGAGKSVRLIKE